MRDFVPGEMQQEIYTDENGVRYDAITGSMLPDAGPQRYGANEVAYYTAAKQPLRYAAVYPGPVNVHVNKALTDLSVAYEIKPGMFIAPEIAKVRTVSKRSDNFFIWQRGDVTRDYGAAAEWAIGAVPNEINQSFDTGSYTAKRYGFRDFLPDEVAANADEALQLATMITEFLTRVIEKGIDARVAVNKMFSTALNTNTTFAAATGTGSGTIATATNTARYINQAFNTAKINVSLANNGQLPTHVVMNQDVAQRIAASVEIADQIKLQMGVQYILNGGWQGRNYGLPDQLYGMNVVVTGLPNNTAVRGQTDSFSLLIGGALNSGTIGFFIVEQPGLKTMNTCTQFRVGGITVRSYRDDPRKGTWIEVSVDQDENITNSVGGYLLTAA